MIDGRLRYRPYVFDVQATSTWSPNDVTARSRTGPDTPVDALSKACNRHAKFPPKWRYHGIRNHSYANGTSHVQEEMDA